MGDVHKNYLFDLGYLLREQALEAQERREKAGGTDDEAFESDRSMAYYEVMSLLVSQADSFQLPIEDLHLKVSIQIAIYSETTQQTQPIAPADCDPAYYLVLT